MKSKLIALIAGVVVLGFTGLAQADFVASKESKTFHKDSCPMVKMIKVENKVVYKTADEATKAGLTLCKKCAAGDQAVKSMFVGNKSSMMVHTAACPMVEKIKEDNVQGFATQAEAEKAGYKLCSKCFPGAKKEEVKAKVEAKKIEKEAKN